MKLSCLVYADDQEKLRNIKTVIVKYCSPDITVAEVKADTIGQLPSKGCPNLIVMDIEDPFPEIMRRIGIFRKSFPEVYFVVYVRYREFTFSNDSMVLENVEFLPKPVRSEALQETITRIIDHIGQIRGEMLATGKLNALVNDNIPVIRQHYLSMLLRTGLSDQEEVKQKFSTLHIECPGPYYTVMVADMPGEREKINYEAVSFLIITSLKSLLKSEGYQVYIFFDSEYRINCLIGHEQANQEISLEHILNRFCSRTAIYLDTFLYVGVGKAVATTTEICDSFLEAEAALRFIVENKSENVIFFRQIEDKIDNNYLINQNVNRIVKSFSVYNLQEVKRVIQSTIYNPEIGKVEKKKIAIKCYYNLLIKAEESGIEISELPEVHRIALQLFDATNEDLCCQYLYKIIDMLADNAEDGLSSEKKNAVFITKQYIEEHLEDSKLSLEEVSRHSGFSKSYYCRLFHAVQGESFSNYLKMRRIERAKHLMEQKNMTIDEVARQSGFSSPKYFSVVFKQITGMTPREYRESHKV